VKVKLLPQDNELYVFAESLDRIAKERSMRRRQLKWLWARLAQLQTMELSRDALLMKLGSAQSKVPAAWRLVEVKVEKTGAAFTYRLNRKNQSRIEAHVFVAFLAYCLYVTLGRQLKGLAPGLTARSALEKFAAVQMVDVKIPTTDGRELLLTRYTQPEPELELLLERLHLTLPAQPPPKISVAQSASATLL
jgi:hypothetical protein